MGSRMVTVASFPSALEAHLAKSRLESEGIACFVADENIVTMNWLYSNAVGGVKLQVDQGDLELARQLLEIPRSRPKSDMATGEVICMNCGSAEVYFHRRPRAVTVLSFFLFFLPLPFFKKCWRCAHCQTEWKV